MTVIKHICGKCRNIVSDSGNFCEHCGGLFDALHYVLDGIEREVNLQKEYNKYNKMFFGGSLPKILLKWVNMNNGGKVTSKLNPDRSTEPLKLEMSKKWDINKEQFANILIHEMIHVWESVNQHLVKGVQHGPFFKAKMADINKKGYNISLEHDVTDLKLSGDEKMKTPAMVAIIYNEAKKDYSIMVFNYKMWGSGEYKKIVEALTRYSEYYKAAFKLTLIESYNSQTKKYPKIGKFKRIIGYHVGDPLRKDVLKEKILYEETLNKNIVKAEKLETV